MNDTHALLSDIHDDALGWVSGQLDQRGIPPVAGLTPVREMAWSLVAKVEHQQGVWFFKCLPTYFSHELAVTECLSTLAPNHVARFIAADHERRFLLVEDAGPMFREVFEHNLDPTMWLTILKKYAHLQISFMQSDWKTKLGVPNRNLFNLPAIIGDDIEKYCQFNSDNESEQCRVDDIKTIRDAFENWNLLVLPLYQYGIGDTINHGDMHDGNLAFRNRPVIFDWGDASLTHPFMSLRSVLSNISRRFNIDENSEQMEPFIRAYLLPWTSFADYDHLRDMLESAKKVWSLVTFLSWRHALQNQNDPQARSYNYALPAVLRTFANDQGKI